MAKHFKKYHLSFVQLTALSWNQGTISVPSLRGLGEASVTWIWSFQFCWTAILSGFRKRTGGQYRHHGLHWGRKEAGSYHFNYRRWVYLLRPAKEVDNWRVGQYVELLSSCLGVMTRCRPNKR